MRPAAVGRTRSIPAWLWQVLYQRSSPSVEDSRLVIGAATHPGPVREQNEDAVWCSDVPAEPSPTPIVMAVADGMGGYQRGEVAAQMAIESLQERFGAADSEEIPLL